MKLEGRLRDNWLYYVARFSMLVALRVLERFRAYGGENVPAEGGCIIAANHASYLDPPALAASINHRVIRFMARDTLFASRIGHWFFTGIQCVALDRTRGDVAALRKGIGILKEGRVLALFPEGTRSLDGRLQEAKGGIGFLISKAEVPVVPAYVEGTFDAFPKGAKKVKPGRVRVYYGAPIQPGEIAALGSGRESYEQIGKLVMSRIAALKDSAAAS